VGTATSADCGKYGFTVAERAGRSTRPSCQRPYVGKRVEGRVETRVPSGKVTSMRREPITILRNPQSVRSDVGKMDVIFPVKSRNYKVSASVGVTTAVLSPVRAILDTGAGPNMIRATVLPEDWERYRVFGAPTLNIVGAGGRRLRQSGTTTLHVEIGGIKFRARFLVMETLAAECILGCQFSNRHVSAILPMEKHVRLSDGRLGLGGCCG
jgi:Retroviral aspartyl protease